MEINELRYFLAVAEVESVQRAGRNLSISPGSLSKAIGRLESELGVKLFRRVGRNIRLTVEGKHLMLKAREITKLEESVRESILGSGTTVAVKIGGSESLLADIGVRLGAKLVQQYPHMKIQFEVCDRSELVARVRDREFDLGITTFEIPTVLEAQVCETIEFATYLSESHPLYETVCKGSVSVHQVVEHPFVVPSGYSMGKAFESESADGWRDDVYPRKVQFEAASIKTIESLILSGVAIGYLPKKEVVKTAFKVIDINDCPYSNIQTVKIFTREKKDYSWKSMLFS